MASSDRPLSPHLQVYRLPLLALMSITHRATGFLLAVAAVMIPVVLLALAAGPESYQCVHALLAAWYGQVLLFLISASLVYHLLNGIRHLIWDLGHNLKVPNAEASGVAVLVLTVLLTAALWTVGCLTYYGGGA